MNDLEIFVITNGRKTFEYTVRSIENQSSKVKITIIEDMIWIDALKRCVQLCDSRFYLRVDDDMFIHNKCAEYFLEQLSRFNQIGVYECKLWEDWSKKPAGSLKMYNTDLVKKIGFRVNKLGKVDKTFSEDIKKTSFRKIKDASMIGIHAIASEEDQIKYRNLWRDKNCKISAKEFENTFDNKIHSFYKDLSLQYEILKKIPKINKKYNTNYFKFLKTGYK